MYSIKTSSAPSPRSGIVPTGSSSTSARLTTIRSSSSNSNNNNNNNGGSSNNTGRRLPPMNTTSTSARNNTNNNNNMFYPTTSNRQLDSNSFDAATIPWQRIHHGNIPAWEQERLLREVLMSMLLRDVVSSSSSPENNLSNNQQENNNNQIASSLHSKATQAATEVMSNFVKSAIVGASSMAFSNNNSSNPNNQVSLGALRVPNLNNQQQKENADNNNDGSGVDGDENEENKKWVGYVQDRRQTQLERLLSDSQNECAILRQQLDDITKAHDDGQRALNQAYHEYDALQRHVLNMNNELDGVKKQQQQQRNGSGRVALGGQQKRKVSPPKIGESADDPKL